MCCTLWEGFKKFSGNTSTYFLELSRGLKIVFSTFSIHWDYFTEILLRLPTFEISNFYPLSPRSPIMLFFSWTFYVTAKILIWKFLFRKLFRKFSTAFVTIDRLPRPNSLRFRRSWKHVFQFLIVTA